MKAHESGAADQGGGDREASEGKPMYIRNLIERVGMINRIHTALRFTLNVEDIHSIILTTMVARSGLDFSRAFLLGYDEGRGSFRGLAALGALSRPQHESLRREIEAEEACLAGMVEDLSGRDDVTQEEEALFRRSLRELANHSFWITIFQKFSGCQNELLGAIQQVELPLPAEPIEPALHDPAGLFREVLTSDMARIIKPEETRAAGLPRQLTELLTQESLWTAVRTQKGVRLILIVDKIYQEEPLEADDLLHMDWFVGQVALALENAEMYKDLESAYNSLRELDRMKSNFLATISHELRTPLTAINGYSQLMLGNKIGTFSQGQKEVLERIHAHSELLTGKVNDLIEIAEMDSGHGYEALMEEVDPLAALMNILPKVESRRAHKGTAIEPIVSSAIPRIRSNRESLERIFFHLIDNAIKFGHASGHVWIEFKTAGEELHISISDDGIGISKNQLQGIFDTFYQIDSQLTRNYEGLGIGLAVIKKQLGFTNGQIRVESQPAQGSTFTIIYPLAEAMA